MLFISDYQTTLRTLTQQRLYSPRWYTSSLKVPSINANELCFLKTRAFPTKLCKAWPFLQFTFSTYICMCVCVCVCYFWWISNEKMWYFNGMVKWRHDGAKIDCRMLVNMPKITVRIWNNFFCHYYESELKYTFFVKCGGKQVKVREKLRHTKKIDR